MRWRHGPLAALAVSLLAAAALGGPPDVPKDPLKVTVGKSRVVTVKTPDDKPVEFQVAADPADCEVFRGFSEPNQVVLRIAPQAPGKYAVVFWTTGEKDTGRTLFILAEEEGGSPRPPPGPPPAPKPDDAPIKEPGLRVMIVFEKSKQTELSAAQQSVIFGKAVRSWLDENCAKSGGEPDYRIVDPDDDLSRDRAYWQAALKLPRTALPWLVVSNPGRGGFQGPLPATRQDFLDLVAKYK